MLNWLKNILLTLWGWIWGLIGNWVESTPVWQLILLGIGVVLGIVLIVVFWKIVRIVIGVLLTGGYLAGAVWLTMMLWRDGDVFWFFLLKEILVVGIYSALFIGLMKSLYEKPEIYSGPYIPSEISLLDKWKEDTRREWEDERERKRKEREAMRYRSDLERYYDSSRSCSNCVYNASSTCTHHGEVIYGSDDNVCSHFSRKY